MSAANAVSAATEHLRVRNLRVGFDTYEGYRDVLDVGELTIKRGESFGLVGESGSGKSVLALALMGLLPTPPASVEADEMSVDGDELTSLGPKQLREVRGKRISMIFQDPMSSLNPVYTVGRQMTNVIHRIGDCSRKEAHAKALELVSLVGLADPETTLQKYAHQLSGGQRQRVVIALALSCGAELLIADEPTRNLDVTVQASVLKTIAELRRTLGVSVLFIANNLGLVAAMCDRVGVLLNGRLVETGTVEEVVWSPQHPHTVDLLRAIPTREEMAAEADAAGASSGDAQTSPCVFYARCRKREAACAGGDPVALKAVGGTHLVACRNAGDSTSAIVGGEAL